MAAFTPTIQELMRAQAGLYGIVYESGTTAITGSFCRIRCLTETTFTTLTDNISGDTFTGVAVAAGVVLDGLFTAVTLTSGTVLLCKSGIGV